MEAKFDVHGVLQIVETVRHKGSRFYLQAAERFIDPQCSELCRQLANWRAAEEGIVGRRKKQITRQPADPWAGGKRDYVSTHPFVMADLEALAHNTGRWARLTGRESTDEILKIAIMRAEDTIAFYHGLKDFVHDPAGIEALDIIITEEKSHINGLIERLTSQEPTAPQTAAES
jgi:rubrerythrin